MLLLSHNKNQEFPPSKPVSFCIMHRPQARRPHTTLLSVNIHRYSLQRQTNKEPHIHTCANVQVTANYSRSQCPLNIKNEPGDSSCGIYMKALDCIFHIQVASYHISWVPYCTAEDHAKYHAKDLKQKEALINDLQMIKTDKKVSKLLVCLTQQIITTNNYCCFCATHVLLNYGYWLKTSVLTLLKMQSYFIIAK